MPAGRDNRTHTDAPPGITHVDRIIGIADALTASNGRDGAGASTGELIAGALVAGHPEWGGYTDDSGYTDVPAMIERLSATWFEYVREAQLVRYQAFMTWLIDNAGTTTTCAIAHDSNRLQARRTKDGAATRRSATTLSASRKRAAI